MLSEIRIALIIPSYNESIALKEFLVRLLPILPNYVAIIIADDSEKEVSTIIENQIAEINELTQNKILIDSADSKSGRGAAVKRGMSRAIKLYPNLEHIIECDADGSHTPNDVHKLLISDETVDMLVGSRYLNGSKISNWPLQRRIFSKILNTVIPRILDVPLKDVTNGLRRYSIRSVKLLISRESINSGFVYLSEQALILRTANYTFKETPIHFVNRIHGESTVTSREVLDSILGISKLTMLNKNQNIK